jgi:hypothetical protein
MRQHSAQLGSNVQKRSRRGASFAWATLAALMRVAAATAANQIDTSGNDLQEIVITAREPRYVAPTLRDRIGRIWAPVLINGKGPFRLVLDTGASHSGVTQAVALSLGLPTDRWPPVLMHGVTGSSKVPTVRVDSLSVGELGVDAEFLPILPDAFGGAQGVLGTEGLANKRIFIDFHHDQIRITYSRGERAGHGFMTLPFRSVRGALIVIDAMIGNIRAKAIIDTGGQATIGNLALQTALARDKRLASGSRDQIQGVSLDIQDGVLKPAPAIALGKVEIQHSRVTFGDMSIFEQWHMTKQPVLLVGMDVLGLLDVLVIDYRRHELQVLLRDHG